MPKKKTKRTVPKLSLYDSEIFPNRWYPTYYRKYKLCVYPQGYYSNNYAIKKLKLKYGGPSLREIYWKKGKTILETDYYIRRSLLIGGKYITRISRLYIPPEFRVLRKRKSFKKTYIKKTTSQP